MDRIVWYFTPTSASLSPSVCDQKRLNWLNPFQGQARARVHKYQLFPTHMFIEWICHEYQMFLSIDHVKILSHISQLFRKYCKTTLYGMVAKIIRLSLWLWIRSVAQPFIKQMPNCLRSDWYSDVVTFYAKKISSEIVKSITQLFSITIRLDFKNPLKWKWSNVVEKVKWAWSDAYLSQAMWNHTKNWMK